MSSTIEAEEWPLIRANSPGPGDGRCVVCRRPFEPGQTKEGCGTGAGDGRKYFENTLEVDAYRIEVPILAAYRRETR